MGTGNTESERVPRNGIKIQQGNGGFRETDGKCPLYSKSYKGNFFPNFTVSGTGLYSNADGSYGIAGGNLPVFLPDGTGQFNPGQPAGFAYFPGINLDYKIGWVYMGGVQMEQPLYMGGKIRAAYKMSLLGKEMAQMNENLTATEVIQKTDRHTLW